MSIILEPADLPGLPERRSVLVFPIDDLALRRSGNPEKPNQRNLEGHAAVYNSLSENLGGFRETLEPGAFRDILSKQPDVKLLHEHDPLHVLGRTKSGTLDLSEDATGLRVFARIEGTEHDWVGALCRSMDRGDVDQMSFAFTCAEGGDDWAKTDDGIVRTVHADGISGLFDVSVVAYPAYTSTDVNIRSLLLAQAVEQGRIPRSLLDQTSRDALDIAQQAAGGGESGSHMGLDKRRKRLTALKTQSRRTVEKLK